MGMVSELSVDLLDGKSAYLLSDEQLNRLITVLGNERERREEEAKNKAIQDFHKAWLKLRDLNIMPRYEGEDYCTILDNFEDLHF